MNKRKQFSFLNEDSELRRLITEMSDYKALSQMAFKPTEELQQIVQRGYGLDRESLLKQEIEHILRFRPPKINETARLFDEFWINPVAGALQRYAEQEASSIKKAMRTPWFNIQEPLRSISGFVGLQGIGHALRIMPPFSDQAAEVLRVNLGDWRNQIAWPEESIFTDANTRSNFYAERGFNPALTNFPAPAFREGLEIAGIYATLPENDDKEEYAHNRLQRLERRIRCFIDDKMTQAFGKDWPKHRLPNGLYERWQEKKVKEEKSEGRELPLIAYADFTDYERVICKSDNWREVFSPVFTHPEGVRESLQRLYPIRVCTMHARLITQDDELFLLAEERRLSIAIEGGK